MIAIHASWHGFIEPFGICEDCGEPETNCDCVWAPPSAEPALLATLPEPLRVSAHSGDGQAQGALLALAQRCERASGVLAGAIERAVLLEAFHLIHPRPAPIRQSGFESVGDGIGPYTEQYTSWAKVQNRFTQLLDAAAFFEAALMLVPKGCWAEGALGSHVDRRASLEIHAPCTYDPLGLATAAIPSLALCAAALKAHGTQGSPYEQ